VSLIEVIGIVFGVSETLLGSPFSPGAIALEVWIFIFCLFDLLVILIDFFHPVL